jgi:hypothetical protein
MTEETDDDEMLTTAQACRALGMSWHSFARWCERLNIAEPSVRHPYDLRLRMVRMSTVDAIRAARAQMPASMPPVRPTEAPRGRAPARRLPTRKTADGLPSASDGDTLPEGLISAEECAHTLGVSAENVRKAMKPKPNGKPPRLRGVPGGPWMKHGGKVKYALDAEGQAEAYRMWGGHHR